MQVEAGVRGLGEVVLDGLAGAVLGDGAQVDGGQGHVARVGVGEEVLGGQAQAQGVVVGEEALDGVA